MYREREGKKRSLIQEKIPFHNEYDCERRCSCSVSLSKIYSRLRGLFKQHTLRSTSRLIIFIFIFLFQRQGGKKKEKKKSTISKSPKF